MASMPAAASEELAAASWNVVKGLPAFDERPDRRRSYEERRRGNDSIYTVEFVAWTE